MPDNTNDLLKIVLNKKSKNPKLSISTVSTLQTQPQPQSVNLNSNMYINCNKFTIKTIDILNEPLKNSGVKYLYAKTKKELISKRIGFLAARCIQRNYRLRLIKIIENEICPISLTSVKFPYYIFKEKCIGTDHTIKIYYNAEVLANYLVSSGKFEDPKTRIPYTDSNIIKLDRILIDNKIKLEPVLSYDYINSTYFDSILNAKKNKNFYKKKKETECDILTYERILDAYVYKIVQYAESQPLLSLELTNYIQDFNDYYKKLKSIFKKYAYNYVNRTILTIKKLKCTSYNVKKYILNFLCFNLDRDIIADPDILSILSSESDLFI